MSEDAGDSNSVSKGILRFKKVGVLFWAILRGGSPNNDREGTIL
jgi:hypothetical protein